MAEERPTPSEQIKQLYEQSESNTARAFEELVAKDSFGELLAKVTENVVAITKISTDVFDLILRNLRLAGRQDIIRLGRQLTRTEEKLELLLQEVERLQESGQRGRSSRSRSTSSNGRGQGGRSRSGAARGGGSGNGGGRSS